MGKSGTLATKGGAALTGDLEDGGWRAGPGVLMAMDEKAPAAASDLPRVHQERRHSAGSGGAG